ncbi:hypothetical protein [Prauserella halophila]|nr:hypothetical protein [Prauserella halophila]
MTIAAFPARRRDRVRVSRNDTDRAREMAHRGELPGVSTSGW